MATWLLFICAAFCAAFAALTLWVLYGKVHVHAVVTATNMDIDIDLRVGVLMKAIWLPVQLHMDVDAEFGVVAFQRVGSRGRYKPVQKKASGKSAAGKIFAGLLLGPNCESKILVRGIIGIKNNSAATAIVTGMLNTLVHLLAAAAGIAERAVGITPDFDGQAAWLQLEGIFKSRVLHIIGAVRKHGKSKEKGGKMDEPD